MSIMVGGLLALAVLFAVGSLVSLPKVERTIAEAVERRLAEANIDVEVRMAGQDVTLVCAVPLPALNIAVRYAAKVDGVRSVALDPSCTTGGIPALDATTSTTIVVDGTAPTTAPTTSTTLPDREPVVEAVLDAGRMTLSGSVASDEQRVMLVDAATVAVGEQQVDDGLLVDAGVALADADLEGIATVTGAMSVLLVSGSVGWDGSSVFVEAVAADDESLDRFRATVTEAFAIVPLVDGSLRATATDADAAAVEAALNALVEAEPILFDKGSVTVSAASAATLQRAAALAEQFGGLRIEVQGHTDSEGDAGRNLTLSEQRAAATLEALVELGVPAADLVSSGFGETQLIRDANGRELPEKSRRVVFVVTLA